MISRRSFLKGGALTLGGLMLSPEKMIAKIENQSQPSFSPLRPPLSGRAFTSTAVEKTIESMMKEIKDPKLAWMFGNCFPNTLDTTVKYKIDNLGNPDTFIITGDIDAMWLRDSSAQVWPYLPLMKNDAALQQMIKGLIRRQFACICFDPYANAFNDGPTGSYWETDMTDMKKELHERKWEIDSLCYPIRLAYHYWKITGDRSVFDSNWEKAMELTIQTFQEQQRKENNGPYSFMRETENQGDTLLNKGWGSPVNPVGLIFSAFRPSDDATMFGFLIPSNMFAVVSLKQLNEIISITGKGNHLLEPSRKLIREVERAIEKHAIIEHPQYGSIYAFEVDGFGGRNLMDDANIPSLISIPYLGYCDTSNPVYQNTRKFVWSKSNPYFFSGEAGEGIGGPHIGFNYIWPMSIIMKGLTSTDREEIKACITQLVNTDANTGFMHESFHKDNPADFTRKWFAWVNTLFGEFILKVNQEYPDLMKESYQNA